MKAYNIDGRMAFWLAWSGWGAGNFFSTSILEAGAFWVSLLIYWLSSFKLCLVFLSLVIIIVSGTLLDGVSLQGLTSNFG